MKRNSVLYSVLFLFIATDFGVQTVALYQGLTVYNIMYFTISKCRKSAVLEMCVSRKATHIMLVKQ